MIRPARREDIPGILFLVRELAAYERCADQVAMTHSDLERALFGVSPKVFAHVAQHEGQVVGIALWFLTFSTWTGAHGIWLEDLIVRQDLRRRGLGRALLRELAAIALRAGYARLEWSVMDWNEPALAFYARLGSAAMGQWTTHRLSGEALQALAGPQATVGP